MIEPEKIKLYLGLFKDLKLNDLMGLIKMAKIRRLDAGEIFIKEGATGTKLSYIKSGLVRAYTTKPNGDEITMILRWEDQFIASHDNIIMNKPSRFTYQAVENTVLLDLDYQAARELFDKNPRFAEARNYIMLNMLSDALTRLEAFILLTPVDRYKKLLKDKPNIVNRVPDKHIATLLGITPVSLSRIRKRITAVTKN